MPHSKNAAKYDDFFIDLLRNYDGIYKNGVRVSENDLVKLEFDDYGQGFQFYCRCNAFFEAVVHTAGNRKLPDIVLETWKPLVATALACKARIAKGKPTVVTIYDNRMTDSPSIPKGLREQLSKIEMMVYEKQVSNPDAETLAIADAARSEMDDETEGSKELNDGEKWLNGLLGGNNGDK